MKNNEIFFVDVLKSLPVEVDCYIQAPDLDNKDILKLMMNTEFPYYKKIEFNEGNHMKIMNILLANYYILDFVQSLEIRQKEKKLFEGYDGIGSGTFSNTLIIPNWFEEKYKLNKDYSISKEW